MSLIAAMMTIKSFTLVGMSIFLLVLIEALSAQRIALESDKRNILDRISNTLPTDRAPNKREARKAKWTRHELRDVEDSIKTIKKRLNLLISLLIGILCAFTFLQFTNNRHHAGINVNLLVFSLHVIRNTISKNWNKDTIAFLILYAGFIGVLICYA